MKSPFASAVALAIGIILLAGYFIAATLMQNIRVVLLDWAIILGGFASIIGIVGLLKSHWQKLRKKDFYSLIFIIAFLFTAVYGLLLGPANPQFEKVVTHIQVPVEASLMAVLFFTLVFALMRLLQKRKTLMGIVFLISVLLFLIISSSYLSFAQSIPGMGNVISMLQALPIAGARGILLGIALGGIATGVRVLIGADRPYRE